VLNSKNLGIRVIKINCLQSAFKRDIMTKISKTFWKLFGENYRETTKFMKFVEQVTSWHHSKVAAKNDRVVIVLDNI
jgi:hypothetical protein